MIMADEISTIKEFKDLSDNERKKVKKDVLVRLLLAAPDLSDVTVAIQTLSEMVDGFKKEVVNNSTKIIELKVELETVKNENNLLRKNLTSRINNLEQRSRINNIEIVGLRKPNALENETLLAIKFIKDVLKAEVEPKDIEALHEVPSRRKDGKRVVVCHFKSRGQRDSLLNGEFKRNLREHNKDLELAHRIYVNEHLSPENRKLFALASKKKHELGYKFLWTKNGVSFARKSENCSVIKIENLDDLANMT